MTTRREALEALATGALLAPFAASAARAQSAPTAHVPDHDMSRAPASWTRPDVVAMLVYPKMTALDLIGPQHMLASLMGAKVHLVAKTLAPVTSDTGVTITPTTDFANCPRDLTVLFTPGGTSGTLAAAEDAETRAFMADRGSRAKYVTSVCTGSLILGAAGLLKGYRATSHWSVRPVLAEFGAIPTEGRVVRDRNRWTGGGVTAGLDFGLAMLAELRDPAYAETVQLISEYDPQPPFHAGSPATAPAEVLDSTRAMFTGFEKQAREMAKRLA